ncbi:MAG: 50S ribosomal protein L18 [Pseudomonadota bacterium]
MANTVKQLYHRRKLRTRHQLRQSGGGRLRLSVFRSCRNIHAQLIDDSKGRTLASASTLDASLRGTLKSGSNIEAARATGALLGERALACGISRVVFDRGGYQFHGRVKALADGAREAGLEF